MSIHFISGKPGGGKTLYSVRLIIDELVHGSRVVITNVPLNLARLNEYLQSKFPAQFERRLINNWPVHITDRVILLDEDDLPKFFTYRPAGVRLQSVSNQEWKAGKRPDFSSVKDGGVLYVLDEVHIAFNARAWADTGHEVLYYLSQHRKLGDDVICITQAIGNVDKQFRSVAQDFTYIKNLSKQRAGLFRLPSMFIRSTYAQPATDNSKAMESGTFSLDMTGIASCYDTAKGVGIHGRAGADTNARKKGIHWLVFVIGLPLLLLLAWHYLPKIIADILTPSRPVPVKVQTVQTNTPSPVYVQRITNELPIAPASVPSTVSVQPPLERSQLTCSGFLLPVSGLKPTAFLSDGTSVEPPELELITKKYILVSGKKIPIVANRTSQKTVSPSPAQIPQSFYSPPPVYDQPSSTVDVTVIGQSRRQPLRSITKRGFNDEISDFRASGSTQAEH